MKLIEVVEQVGEGTVVTAARVRPHWPAFADGSVDALILVELVAQSAAVCIGWQHWLRSGRPPSGRGWLVGVKQADFKCRRLAAGMQVRIRTRLDYAYENYTAVLGEAVCGDRLLAEVQLQVLRAEDGEALRKEGPNG